MRQKLCYIISHVQKSLAFEWTSVRLKDKYDLVFILLNPDGSTLEEFLIQAGIRVERVIYRDKKDLFRAFHETIGLLRGIRPNIVHCHLLDAQLIGLTAARWVGVRKRIYTRHNSNFHHVYARSGVRYDKWSNRMATHIVSISQATDKTLSTLEDVDAKKIRTIHHGFDFEQFSDVSAGRETNVRSHWSISSRQIVIGVIARHIEWKGIQYIIPAFAKLNKQIPSTTLVLANATGPYHQQVLELIRQYDLTSVVLCPFEEDVAALYKTFNIYVHTPVDPICEAFGQTYVEALAMGVPSVFTPSGIAAEFVVDGQHALLVPFRDSDSIYHAMIRLLNDDALREHLQKNGRDEVYSRFGIDKMIRSLAHLYDE